MPKEIRKEHKQTPYEKQQDGTSSNSLISVKAIPKMFQMFTKEHSKELNQSDEQNKQALVTLEDLKKFETERNMLIDGLKDYVETKEEGISIIQASFDKLKKYVGDFSAEFENAKKKYAQAEIDHEQVVEKLLSQIKELNEAKSNVDTIILAKESECAAYLRDMKAELDKAISNENKMKDEVNELKMKVTDLETKLQDCEHAAEIAAAKTQADLLKKTKKLQKKNERILELKVQLENLDAEKKELEKKLEIQGHKMRELQTVLDRPCRLISPNGQVEKIPIDPIRQSNVTSSPGIIENTQMNNEMNASHNLRSRTTLTPNRLYSEHNFSDIEIEENRYEGSPIVGVEASNSTQTVRSSLLKRYLTDSEDFDFPAYSPQRNKKQRQ